MSENQLFNIIDHKLDDTSQRVFNEASPFPHIVIDNFLNLEVAEEVAKAFPDQDAPFWYQYNNPIEIKLACNLPEYIPPYILGVLTKLNSQPYLDYFSKLSGIDKLKADPQLHGGGMHCIKSGGKLDMHIDYSIHPTLNLERRLNLILYLNKDWKEEYGGHLELWEKDMSDCAKMVLPAFNRAVLFATNDDSWHGHPNPLRCPSNMARKSLALYYLTEPRENATKRYKAQFVGKPGDAPNPELDELRRLRSQLNTADQVWNIGKSKGT